MNQTGKPPNYLIIHHSWERVFFCTIVCLPSFDLHFRSFQEIKTLYSNIAKQTEIFTIPPSGILYQPYCPHPSDISVTLGFRSFRQSHDPFCFTHVLDQSIRSAKMSQIQIQPHWASSQTSKNQTINHTSQSFFQAQMSIVRANLIQLGSRQSLSSLISFFAQNRYSAQN